MEKYAIEAKGLSKTFGNTVALKNFNLKVNKGHVHALLGPNGAGKTTLVKILATLTRPDQGEVNILGKDLLKEPKAVRELISLTGQSASVDEELTGRENMFLIARLLGFSAGDARKRSRVLMKSFGLEKASNKLVKNYSGGMRRRLDIAVSILKIPSILFLDEPTTGLDPRSRNNLWRVIKALAERGTTVVLTTQYLEEADQLADRISVIDRGELISEGTSDELKSSVGENILHLYPSGDNARKLLIRQLADFRLEIPTESDSGGPVNIRVANTEAAIEWLDKIRANGDHIRSFSLSRPNLDEVFLALTGRPAEEDAGQDGKSPASNLESDDAVSPNPEEIIEVVNPGEGPESQPGK